MFSEPIVGQERADLINKVMLCRAKGMSMRRTASKLNISLTEVFRLEKEGLKETVDRLDMTLIDEVRAQQLAKCQELYDVLADELVAVTVRMEGDKQIETKIVNLKAVDSFIDVMKREADIMGSDAPKRKEIERKKVKDFSSSEARKKAFDDLTKKYGINNPTEQQ